MTFEVTCGKCQGPMIPTGRGGYWCPKCAMVDLKQDLKQDLKYQIARLKEANCCQIATNAKWFERLQDQGRRIGDLATRLDDAETFIDGLTDEPAPVPVETKECDGDGPVEDADPAAHILTIGIRVQEEGQRFGDLLEGWLDQLETARDLASEIWRAAAEDDRGCWVASDALAMANAFHAFRQAGATEMTAESLVQMWLEHQKANREPISKQGGAQEEGA